MSVTGEQLHRLGEEAEKEGQTHLAFCLYALSVLQCQAKGEAEDPGLFQARGALQGVVIGQNPAEALVEEPVVLFVHFSFIAADGRRGEGSTTVDAARAPRTHEEYGQLLTCVRECVEGRSPGAQDVLVRNLAVLR